MRVVTIRPKKVTKPGQYVEFGAMHAKGKSTYALAKDVNGQWQHGHSAAELASYKYIKVDDAFWSTYKLTLTADVKRLEVDKNERDMIDYRVAKVISAEIASSVSAIGSNTKFVMYDEQEEAKTVNLKHEYKVTAYTNVSKMTPVEKREFLTLFGLSTKNVTDEVVYRKLVDMADFDPKAFNEKYEDTQKETKILLRQLIEYGILTVDKLTKAIYYRELVVGLNESTAVAYIDNMSNQQLVIEWTNRLDEIKRR